MPVNTRQHGTKLDKKKDKESVDTELGEFNKEIERFMEESHIETNFKVLLEIFLIFLKIGAFTFGGGYAMIPIIEHEVANKRGWVTTREIVDLFAISESIPGAIAVNTASLIGYKKAGKKGAITATAGVVLPSFVIISLIAAFFSKFQNIPMIKAAFSGVRAALVALIALAAVRIGKASIKNRISLIIVLLALIFVVFLNIHAIFVIIAGGVLGLFLYFFYPHKLK